MDNLNDNLLWDMWLSRLFLPAIAVANEIDLFTSIHKLRDLHLVANQLGIQLRGIQALSSFMASLGFVVLDENIIKLTNIALKYLLPNSKYYWGVAFSRIKNSDEYHRMLDAIKNKPANLHSHGKNLNELWQSNTIDSETAISFTKIMDCTILNSAELAVTSNVFDGVTNLLDLGGGSGCFSKLFVEKYLSSYATIYELDGVCAYLKDTIHHHRIKVHMGNFLTDDIPNTHDCILLSNILHDWNLEIVNKLLEKCFKALPSQGTIIINEMLLDKFFANKTAYAFNLLMYINHGSQQFTKSQLYNVIQSHEFINLQSIELGNYYTIIKASKP